jgi:RNA polymerase sigma-70 factor (ECF subfamily)
VLTAANPDQVARLMARFRQGDPQAAGELVETFYPELRRLAAARMKHERSDHTWQPTVLVNELYLELVKVRALSDSGSGGDAERQAFLNLAAHLMKRLLIHHSRPLSRRLKKEGLSEIADWKISGPEALAQIDNALERLAAIQPELRTVVELKVFEGLGGEEIAKRMNCGTATVTRYWSFARRWLSQEFSKTLDSPVTAS